MEFTDPLNNIIRVGDRVVYPTTSGRSPIIVLATVKSIEDKSHYRFDHYTQNNEWIEEYVVGVHLHQDLTKWATRSTTRTSYPTWINIVKFGV